MKNSNTKETVEEILRDVCGAKTFKNMKKKRKHKDLNETDVDIFTHDYDLQSANNDK